ncbi:MAG TPA: hypothetical protein PKM25_00705 [Candidatus Ozemobacteraceae bacterium]|nr:hypothetical protein [Candidatus Ozemobacteraceae bacterium]
MTGIQGRNCGRISEFHAFAFLLILLLSLPGLSNVPLEACDVDLLAIIEVETASFPVSASWIEAARATAQLSDALNTGSPASSIVHRWNEASWRVSVVAQQTGNDPATDLGSATRLVDLLIGSGDFISAHEALQRQFRLIIQGISKLELPVRVSSLAALTGTVWSIAEASRDRDTRRFRNEIAGLASSIQTLESSLAIASDADLTEAVRYWGTELEKHSASAGEEWPDELFLAASQLKNALIQFHKAIRIRLPEGK